MYDTRAGDEPPRELSPSRIVVIDEPFGFPGI
jgi:hypothetical protein